MPSIQLNGGQHFRIQNAKSQDITTKDLSPDELTGARLQIDQDGDGKYTGSQDLTLQDPDQLAALVDQKKGNADQSIPFVNEIEAHLLKVPEINRQVAYAAEQGLKAKNTSVFRLGQKMAYGKEAFFGTQTAFYSDRANPRARFAYASALLGINNSAFSGKASKSLEIDLAKLTQEMTSTLAKDTFDIRGQILLKALYHATDNPAEKEVDQHLVTLKKQFPAEYAEAEKMLAKVLEESAD